MIQVICRNERPESENDSSFNLNVRFKLRTSAKSFKFQKNCDGFYLRTTLLEKPDRSSCRSACSQDIVND